MTLTLKGRWQTRLLLYPLVGGGLAVLFGLLFGSAGAFAALLGYWLLSGMVWDVVYTGLQTLRWDHDWPPWLALLTAVWEVVFLWLVVQLARANGFPTPSGLWGLKSRIGPLPFGLYSGLVWWGVFLLMQGPMRVLFPRWRFRGGQWL